MRWPRRRTELRFRPAMWRVRPQMGRVRLIFTDDQGHDVTVTLTERDAEKVGRSLVRTATRRA